MRAPHGALSRSGQTDAASRCSLAMVQVTRLPVRLTAPSSSRRARAALTFCRLAPTSSASSFCDMPRSNDDLGCRSPASRCLHLERKNRANLTSMGCRAIASDCSLVSRRRWHRKAIAARATLGVRLDQAVEPRLREGHDFNTREGGRIGRAGASVETGDLAKNIARVRVLERECPPVRREDRETDAPLDDEKNVLARIAADKDRLPRLEGRPAHLCGYCKPIGMGQRAEQCRLAEDGCDGGARRHMPVSPRNRHHDTGNYGLETYAPVARATGSCAFACAVTLHGITGHRNRASLWPSSGPTDRYPRTGIGRHQTPQSDEHGRRFVSRKNWDEMSHR